MLYGTTENGGANSRGTVFRITTNGTLTTLASFNGTNGSFPYATLAWGRDVTLYGTTSDGGSNGNGNVFRLNLNSQMLPLARVGASWKISFVGMPGATYRVLRATNVTGSWTLLGNVTAATDGSGQFTDSSPPAGKGFYRVGL